MIDFLRSIQIDRISFWLGFLAGALFGILVAILKVYLPRLIRVMRTQIQSAREEISAGTESRLRNDMLRFAQKQHLAAALFALDEIAITPHLMTPPPPTVPGGKIPAIDVVNLTIPYMPDWPEMAAVYHAPTITLVEALHGGANLIVIGRPGSGKTVALAHLASLIVRHDPEAGEYIDYLPILIHAADISPITETKTALDILIDAVTVNASVLTIPRLPSLIKSSLNNDRIIILLDGMDELHPENITTCVSFIESLSQSYPSTRFVVAASINGYDGLAKLGLIPMAMASWRETERLKFITNWGKMWHKYVDLPDSDATGRVPSLLLRGWLSTREAPSTPLELTLKVWSSYAGDILGADLASSIDAHIRRLTVDMPDADNTLEQIALQMLVQGKLTIRQSDFDKSSPQSSQAEEDAQDLPPDADIETVLPANEPIPSKDAQRGLSALAATGLFVNHVDASVSFSHPLIAAYLAARGLTKTPITINLIDQPDWIFKLGTLSFLACYEDMTPIVDMMLSQDDFLYSQSMNVARWLPNAPRNATWRAPVLRNIANIIQKEYSKIGLCSRLVSALSLSGDPGIIALFRQMLKSERTNLQILAALGCGLLQDPKAVDDLLPWMNEPIPGIVRSACLALVAIGNKKSLEEVASALVQGSDLARQSAAEALANHAEEGYPALEDGSTMQDLRIRRAVVFGLYRVNEPWAVQLLEKIQLEENEWIVKTAAIQALEDIHSDNPYIPLPITPLTELPWLIAFAGKLGVGVAPGKPAEQLLLRALKEGTEEERLAALDYVRLQAFEEALPFVYECYQDPSEEISLAAYNTLWHMQASSVSLQSSAEE